MTIRLYPQAARTVIPGTAVIDNPHDGTIEPTLLGICKMIPGPALIWILFLMAATILISPPLATFIWLFLKTKSILVRAILCFVFWVIPAAAIYASGFVGNTASRVSLEHSVSLPESASRISCDGFFAITTLGDFDAYATFEIDRADLKMLLDQFRIDQQNLSSYDLSQMTTTRSGFGALEAIYKGFSKDGNFVLLQIFGISQDRVGVRIHTSWN